MRENKLWKVIENKENWVMAGHLLQCMLHNARAHVRYQSDISKEEDG